MTARRERSARAVRDRAEIELAFAGLNQVLVPVIDRVEDQPQPRREAMPTVFG